MNITPRPDIECKLDALFDCIRDGIELNYESWVVWQAIARGVIASNLYDRYKELDDMGSCFKIYKDRINMFRRMKTADIFSEAGETIAMFNSLTGGN